MSVDQRNLSLLRSYYLLLGADERFHLRSRGRLLVVRARRDRLGSGVAGDEDEGEA